jgi:hypothetical protein
VAYAPSEPARHGEILFSYCPRQSSDSVGFDTSRKGGVTFLTVEDAEKAICRQVSGGQLFCKIDRIAGVAVFARNKSPNDVLNEWANDIDQLLSKIDRTCHLIGKEVMLHSAA